MVGKAKLKISGNVMMLRATLEDSAKLAAFNLTAMRADIKTNENSEAEVKATDRIKVVAFGASKIFYSSQVATVNQKAIGTSIIKAVDTTSSN